MPKVRTVRTVFDEWWESNKPHGQTKYDVLIDIMSFFIDDRIIDIESFEKELNGIYDEGKEL